MAYAFPGTGARGGAPCHYGLSRLEFRGPERPTTGAFIACLGGSETYGPLVAEPFADLLEDRLDLPVANLACANASPDFYLAEEPLLSMISRARVAVVQLCGAHNLTNRFYTVHPRRNDRLLGPSPRLQSLFHDIDFIEFNFTRHMLSALAARSPDRFELVAEELRSTWVLQMRRLLTRLACPVVLLWMAGAAPPAPARRCNLTAEPLLVDTEMIAAIRPLADSLVQVIAPPRGAADGPFAHGLPDQAHHEAVAAALAPALRRLLG